MQIFNVISLRRITLAAACLLGSGLVSPLRMATATPIPLLEGSSGAMDTDEKPVDYNRDIRPILSEYCMACHGFDPEHRAAGLRLDQFEGATAELDSGAFAIKPNQPDDSELLVRVLADDESMRMPPEETGKRLTAEQIELLRTWISQGAEYSPHWAFTPVQKPNVPEIDIKFEKDLANPPVGNDNDNGAPRDVDFPEQSDWSNPVDAFIDSALIEKKISPSPIAPPSTLVRRLYLDLIGLPPTPEQVVAFEKAYRAEGNVAYRELVDELLSSQHYGERWGRWWLDQARYADSNGYSIDSPRSIWPYRDWVIEALNDDMPFSQFIVEQLAGDLLENPTQKQLVATGFHRNTQFNEEGGIDPEQFRIERVFDRVATTGTVFLGLTIGCAQCHDHKFDPISHREYYQLFAFFNDQDEPVLKLLEKDQNLEEMQSRRQATDRELKAQFEQHGALVLEWEKSLTDQDRTSLPKKVQDALVVEPSKRNMQQRTAVLVAALGADNPESINSESRVAQDRLNILLEIDRTIAKAPSSLVMKERSEPRPTTVFIQGDFTRPADVVTPGTPQVLHPLKADKEYYNRLDLAQWIIAPENPLTTRVLVNRVWQQYFGRGIVETENDFGLQSSVPTHPELLDWLASNWREAGLRLKDLHRQIVCSNVYMRDSAFREDLVDIDRDNYWLARQQRLRLDAEIVRDVGLSASGLLVPKVGGEPVFPPIPDGVMNQGQVQRNWKASVGESRYRRGIYTFIYRATPPPLLNVFDAPEGNATCTRRNRSNTPLQALTMLNDLSQFEFAQSLQKIVESEGIETAFLRCTSRLPSAEELEILTKLDSLSVARVLLNLDETITRE